MKKNITLQESMIKPNENSLNELKQQPDFESENDKQSEGEEEENDSENIDIDKVEIDDEDEEDIDSELQQQNQLEQHDPNQSSIRPESKLTMENSNFRLLPVEELYINRENLCDKYGDDIVLPNIGI